MDKNSASRHRPNNLTLDPHKQNVSRSLHRFVSQRPHTPRATMDYKKKKKRALHSRHKVGRVGIFIPSAALGTQPDALVPRRPLVLSWAKSSNPQATLLGGDNYDEPAASDARAVLESMGTRAFLVKCPGPSRAAKMRLWELIFKHDRWPMHPHAIDEETGAKLPVD